MGAKATIAAIVPATTHTTAAQSLGRSSSGLLTQAQTTINDTIQALKQIVADMTKGNVSDPNITALNTVITNLS